MNVSGSYVSMSPVPRAPVASNANARQDNQVGGKAPSSATPPSAKSTENAQGLTPEQLKTLSELKARDREVRAHEAAHQAVGGQYTGAISYVYQRGPDGAQYAVGGEVSIDTSPVAGDPEATIDKMRTVRAAALAPAEPSAQDRAVAAQAMQIMLQAQAERASESQSAELASASRSGQTANQIYGTVSSFAPPEASQSASSPQSFQTTA